MQSLIAQVEAKYKKPQVVDVKSGDTVRVHQKVREGNKERVQIFEGLVIRTHRKGSLTSNFTVRRIASGVGVEKTFLIHAPNILKVEVIKRSKVRRNYLSYMRNLAGKQARLAGIEFDKEAVNKIRDEAAEAEEAKLHEQAEAEHEKEAAKKAKEEAKTEAEVEAIKASHEETEQKPESK